MRRTAAAVGALVLLLFTGASLRRAEAQQPVSGAVARAGTAVGFSEIGDRTISTLGGQIAIGYRLGPVQLDVEYEDLAMLQILDDRSRNLNRGALFRVGVTGRVFILRLGSRRPDPRSAFRLYLEGGAGRQRGKWSTGEEFDRTDASAGGGWLLEHRLAPGGTFRTIGWQFGWRASGARPDGENVFLRQTPCKGKACPPPMPGPDVDLSLLVTCSIAATW